MPPAAVHLNGSYVARDCAELDQPTTTEAPPSKLDQSVADAPHCQRRQWADLMRRASVTICSLATAFTKSSANAVASVCLHRAQPAQERSRSARARRRD